jgi:hypothetical protein
MLLDEEMEFRDVEGTEFGYDPYCIALEGTGAAMGAVMGASWYGDSDELATSE